MEVVSNLEAYDNDKQDRIRVNIDVDLEDIIPGYLANRYHDAESIRAALAGEDYETIRILGHSLKGSGGGYGFDAITGFGHLLEVSAKNQDKDKIRTIIARLIKYLDCVEVFYEKID
jgi:HPt (histidine-containing phosphotransfer) domain-containing protein